MISTFVFWASYRPLNHWRYIMRFVPNILSVSRVVLFTPLIVWMMLQNQLFLAMLCLAVGIATDWLDGYVARRYNCVTQLGAGLLESVTDLVLAGVAVTMLIVTEYWSFWHGAVLLLIAGVLQLISWLADWFPCSGAIMLLKRHQNYLHPFYAVIIMVVTLAVYVWIATDGYHWLSMLLYAVVTIAAVAAKRDRIRMMMRWPV